MIDCSIFVLHFDCSAFCLTKMHALPLHSFSPAQNSGLQPEFQVSLCVCVFVCWETNGCIHIDMNVCLSFQPHVVAYSRCFVLLCACLGLFNVQIGRALSEQVTGYFTPSQPVQLCQGELGSRNSHCCYCYQLNNQVLPGTGHVFSLPLPLGRRLQWLHALKALTAQIRPDSTQRRHIFRPNFM